VYADEHRQSRLIRRVKHYDVAVAGRSGFVDAGGGARLGEGGEAITDPALNGCNVSGGSCI
jgi:hypothetical protein